MHVTDDFTPGSGGVPAVVRQLSSRLVDAGHLVSVLHATGDGADMLGVVQQVIACPPSKAGSTWWYGPKLRDALTSWVENQQGRPSLVHLHGIWAAPQFFAARSAYRAAQPFMISPHGMLSPWLWSQQGWAVRAKKRLYWQLIALPTLGKAAVIHAITPLEQAQLRALFPKCRVAVIPNAIDIGSTAELPMRRDKVILFLGRIDSVKGVDILIQAFHDAGLSYDWVLQIAGPAWSAAYKYQLTKLVSTLALQTRVKFIGPVMGQEKRRLLENAWVMVAPSHSEVIGLVNLEAAERQLPSITTHQTGLTDWQEGGGLLVNPVIREVALALRQAASWSDSERAERGMASWQLVQSRYSWKAVLPQWLQLYAELEEN